MRNVGAGFENLRVVPELVDDKVYEFLWEAKISLVALLQQPSQESMGYAFWSLCVI